ncbi:nucleoside triphosphate hydrolase [[Pantoea] beijingensis]|uniref:8-oxo-dGTP diphosphatase n=1 Tax=[Pantoea] beijingensis TaxID=1324864 RepID=A0A443I8W5_9GAMM|nr:MULTISPECIES: 8-oxo-dGTP diphosphatase MutT [Erwiniaceae]RWR00522.1 nucleoside triphosphate hydrolase [[Pantoea] beijingensis]
MKHLQVAVGIIRNARQEIFLARRSASASMANMWEFPGGKVEEGESALQGLKRELLEETGINVVDANLFDIVEHAYDDLHVTLHFFLVEQWQGEPYGREGQPSRWVAQTHLMAEDFPPANQGIVARLKSEIA